MVEFQGELKSLSEAQYSQLKKEILETGFAFPIHIWRHGGKNYIVGGHQRKRVLGKLREEGYEVPPLPVVFVEAKSMAEAKRRVLQDISQYGKVERQGLYEFMQEAEFSIEDLSTSFEIPDAALDMDSFRMEYFEDNTVPPEEDDSSVPGLAKDAISRRGDIFRLGKHRLLCGDATLIDDLEKLMAGQKANQVITDPPYNVAYVGKTKEALTIQNDEMDGQSFYQFLYDAFSNMLAFTKKGSAIYVAHADTEGANFRKALTESGWLLKQCLIWVKQSLVMGRQDYHWRHEPILYGWAPGGAHRWFSDRKQTTVLEFNRPSRNEEHPTMKPIELIEYLITNSSERGDIVLDTFGGSGSTLIACERLKRVGYLMELEPRYCDVILKRWKTLTGKEPMRLNEDGTETPWVELCPEKAD